MTLTLDEHLLRPSMTVSDGRFTSPDFPESQAGEWYVLHTKSRQEKAVAETLDAMGVSWFLPLTRQVRYYGKRKFKVELPLFPSYVFLRGTLEDAFAADRTRRIARVLPVVEQDQLDAQLRDLHLALARGAGLDPYPYLAKGTQVVVRSGPFRGLRGVVDSRLKRNRLLLQVDMLGRAASMEMDGALLEPIEDAPA